MDVHQAISMIADTWKDVKQTTVANCWRHVGILQPSEDQDDNTHQQNDEDIRSLIGNIHSTTSHLDIDPSEEMTAKDCTNDSVETEQSLTDDQIVEVVSGGTNDAVSDEDKPEVAEEPPPPPPTITEAHMACQQSPAYFF